MATLVGIEYTLGRLVALEGDTIVIDFGKLVLMVYAVAMAIGGVMGKVKGSNISLIAGMACAVLLGICYANVPRKPKSAFGFGAVIGLAMAVQMFMRFQKTGHFMPAGLISVISLISGVLLVGVWSKVEKSA